jgi:hypothetical protein
MKLVKQGFEDWEFLLLDHKKDRESQICRRISFLLGNQRTRC